MRSRLALVALLALSCRPALAPDDFAPLAPEERAALAATLETWRAHGFPTPPTCDLERVRVVRDAGPFEELCGAPPRGADRACPEGADDCAVGCFNLARPDGGTALREERATVAIAVAPELGPVDARRVLVHEGLHWLGWCSGVGEDRWHLRDGWWGDAQTYPEGGMVRETLDALEGVP